jgi:hypothetical protein
VNFSLYDDEVMENAQLHHLKEKAKLINETGYELLSWILFKTEHDDDLVRSSFAQKSFVEENKEEEKLKRETKQKEQKVDEEKTKKQVPPSSPQDKILSGLCCKSFENFGGGLFLPGNLFSCLIQLLGFDSSGIDFCSTKYPTQDQHRQVAQEVATPNVPIRSLMKGRFFQKSSSDAMSISFAIASRLIGDEFNIIETILTKCVRFFGKVIVDRQIDDEGFLSVFTNEEVRLFDNCVRLLSCLDILEEVFLEHKNHFLKSNDNNQQQKKLDVSKRIRKVVDGDAEVERSVSAIIEGRVKVNYRGFVRKF